VPGSGLCPACRGAPDQKVDDGHGRELATLEGHENSVAERAGFDRKIEAQAIDEACYRKKVDGAGAIQGEHSIPIWVIRCGLSLANAPLITASLRAP
jgi:hypothetical protein